MSVVLIKNDDEALRSVCYSDVSTSHFLNKIAIIRTFS